MYRCRKLAGSPAGVGGVARCRHLHAASVSRTARVQIGGVSAPRCCSADPTLVPAGYITSDTLRMGTLLSPAQQLRMNPVAVSRTSEETQSAMSAVDGSPELLGHLRWLLQTHVLGRDVWLVGGPGPSRRRLLLAFAELMGQEVECVTISRDTTESDIKQRRELVGTSSLFVDQGPVRAALHGRMLVLDGVERAERNILPLLNNLLENREMALEDGRFLVSPSRWQLMLAGATASGSAAGAEDRTDAAATRLRSDGFLPVHPQFRVSALGLPVPPFPGRPLDPPLRSRFVARYVAPSTAAEMTALLAKLQLASGGWVGSSSTTRSVGSSRSANTGGIRHNMGASLGATVALAMSEMSGPPTTAAINHAPKHTGNSTGSSSSVGMDSRLFPPPFPLHTLPWLSVGPSQHNLHQLYPFFLMQEWNASSQSRSASVKPRGYANRDVRAREDTSTASALSHGLRSLFSQAGLPLHTHTTHHSTSQHHDPPPAPLQALGHIYIEHAAIGGTVAAAVASLRACRDVLLVGPRGVGQSTLARAISHHFARRLPLVFALYADMSTRDLLQRRGTRPLPDGRHKSVWINSLLVEAAIDGRVSSSASECACVKCAHVHRTALCCIECTDPPHCIVLMLH